MNITLENAQTEGGPRNGVMTALDDFLAEHDVPVRLLVIPIYFGLAIVAEERLLDDHPELRRLLDELESQTGKQRLLELSEQIRIDATVFEHNMMRVRDEQLARANDRYLTLLRGALLDEHYLENEVRIGYLLECTSRGGPAHTDHLRAPDSFLRKELLALRQTREFGQSDEDGDVTAYFPYTAMGGLKLGHLDAALRTVRDEAIPGDLVECGPGRGGAGVYMRAFLEVSELTDRQVWLAGRFRSSPAGDAPERPLEDGGVEDLLADLNQVREAFARFDLLDERVRFLQGGFDATLPGSPIGPVALIRIGADLGAETADALEHLYDRLSPGGFVIVESTTDPAGRDALEAFRRRRGITSPMERVGWSGRAWRKDHGSVSATVAPTVGEGRDHAPLAPAAPTEALDLSVVVVFYNMRREAARTLHSLSRAYQQGIDELQYEVIVVENGSDAVGAARRGVRQQLRARVQVSRPRRRRNGVTDRRAQPGDPDRARTGLRAHDRRRPRRHSGRPEIRHLRPADLRSRGRRDPAVVRRAGAAAGRRRQGL